MGGGGPSVSFAFRYITRFICFCFLQSTGVPKKEDKFKNYIRSSFHMTDTKVRTSFHYLLRVWLLESTLHAKKTAAVAGLSLRLGDLASHGSLVLLAPLPFKC